MSRFRDYLGLIEPPPVTPGWKFPTSMIRSFEKLLGYSESMNTATTGPMVLYADGTDGSDSNNGFVYSKAKKTLAAVFAMVPKFVNHNVVIHLRGTFSDAGNVSLSPVIAEGVKLIIDGGDAITVMDDNGGNNYEASGSSNTTIADSSASLPMTAIAIVGGAPTVVTWDAYMGLWVKLIGGNADGEIRTIQGHDATTINVHRNWSEDPGTEGTFFQIVRPSTQIENAAVFLKNLGPGDLYLQSVFVGHETSDPGTARLVFKDSPGDVHLSHAIVNSVTQPTPLYIEGCNWLQFVDRKINTATFVRNESAEGMSCGVSQTSLLPVYGTYILTSDLVLTYSFITPSFSAYKCQAVQCWFGTRADLAYMNNCPTDAIVFGNFASNTGYNTTRFGGHPVYKNLFGGIRLNGSTLAVGAVDVSGCAVGIEMLSSQLRVFAPTGDNTAAGVSAKQNSSIRLSAAGVTPFTPTLSGNLDTVDVSVDGTSSITTWVSALTTPIASNGNVEGLNVRLVPDLYVDLTAAPPVQ